MKSLPEITLKRMSYEQVQSFIHKAQETLLEKRAEAMAETRARIVATAKQAGFSIEEVLGRHVGGGKRKRPSHLPVQFRNPSNDKETWTGMGRQPNWLKAALARNAKLDDFRVGG